jgi:uncharacterized protein (DUF2236 family)
MSTTPNSPVPAPGALERFRRNLLAEIEAAGGRHDEPAIYDGEPGDPGLAGGPSSLSWEIHGDLATLAAAGGGAILMELLHPSVMAGVFAHSSYRTDTLRRARNTLGYVLRTTFGSTPAAMRVIESVKNVHARIAGVRPDGVPYRALDPVLIAWVHTSIPWAVMNVYDRYRRPLRLEEKNRYLREQAVIGRLGGADSVPESVGELEEYVEKMRPQLRFNEQTRSFLDFLEGKGEDLPGGRLERLDRWSSVRASMDSMPAWSRQMTGTDTSAFIRHTWLRPHARLRTRLVRWACGELPCKRMALARVAGERIGASPRALGVVTGPVRSTPR